MVTGVPLDHIAVAMSMLTLPVAHKEVVYGFIFVQVVIIHIFIFLTGESTHVPLVVNSAVLLSILKVLQVSL